MNKFFFAAVILAMISCNNKKEDNKFVVKGTVKNSTAKMVYLQENPAGAQPVIIDSAELSKEGSYKLAGTGKEEGIYSLRTNEAEFPFALLVNDAKEITVDADLTNKNDPYSVKGSAASQAIIDFEKGSMERAKKIYDLSVHVDSLVKSHAPDTLINIPFSQYEAAAVDLKNFASGFLEKPSSPVLTIYALGSYQRLATQLRLKPFSNLEVADIINKAVEKFPAHTALVNLKKQQLSKQAPDFTLPDPTGKQVSLSSFKGKYVLVDFWASWCGPCRAENPNVVKAYNQYKDKNFTILGVSLDKSKAAWVEAIQADNLTWNHVSDLQYWNSAAAALYQVSSIPYNVLIDPNGNIVAEDLRGKDLEETLQKVLK